LQKSYLGKIKVVCIDPPYNTGNEFIYPDKFGETLETYLEYTGQVDGEGKKWTANAETDGRFHSKWMNMMYPRLFLAKNLLREDGVIFISIDDNESYNLRAMCNEIFGEEYFQTEISWQKKYSVSNNYKGIASIRELILVYSKSEQFINGLLPRSEESINRYANPDNDPRGVWKSVDYWNQASPEDRPNLVYNIVNPNTNEIITPSKKAWKYSKETHEIHLKENRIWWGQTGRNSVPALKLFLTDVRDGLIPHNWWAYEEAGHTDEAKKELDKLFGVSPFDTPKPVKLLKRIFQVANLNFNDIALDFFAGSATTAHAIMDLNNLDGGNRKFICVQIPEPTDDNSEAGKAGYKTIAEISKERIRRVITKIKTEQKEAEQKQERQLFETKKGNKIDLGFKVLKLQKSNFKVWDSAFEKEPELIQQKLFEHIQHISPEAQQEAILYELLLKSGFELTTPIEALTLAGKTVFSIADGQLLICLEKEITHDCIKAMAEKEPSRVICLDEAFTGTNADALKTNAVQIMKSKGVVNFRTI